MSKKFVTDYGEDSIGKYFKEVRKSALLTNEQEVALANRIPAGDEAAVEEALQRAQDALAEKMSDEEIATVEASIQKSLAQLHVKRRHRKTL